MVGKTLMRTPPPKNSDKIRTRSSSKTVNDEENVNTKTEGDVTIKNITLDDSVIASNVIDSKNECVYSKIANEANATKCNNCLTLQTELTEVKKNGSNGIIKK